MKILAVSLVVAACSLAGGQALAATSHHATPKTLNVVMHDPGCHWFSINGKITKTASVAGPISLRDLDENTLKIASKSGMQYVRVGKSLVLGRGHYVIMMVGQAVDDNYLKLTVR